MIGSVNGQKLVPWVTYIYFAGMLIAVFLPEIVYAIALVSGVREIRSSGLVGLENGNWEYAVLYAWIFSLLFGSAFILGAISRAGFLTLRRAGAVRQRVVLWIAVVVCIGCEIAHWRGFVGLRHFAKM